MRMKKLLTSVFDGAKVERKTDPRKILQRIGRILQRIRN